MKTVEQLIFEKRFKDAEFDPNDYNDWAKENEYEAYTLCLAVAKQLQQHLVMGQSEQLVCDCMPDPKCRVENNKVICNGCNKERK